MHVLHQHEAVTLGTLDQRSQRPPDNEAGVGIDEDVTLVGASHGIAHHTGLPQPVPGPARTFENVPMLVSELG